MIQTFPEPWLSHSCFPHPFALLIRCSATERHLWGAMKIGALRGTIAAARAPPGGRIS